MQELFDDFVDYLQATRNGRLARVTIGINFDIEGALVLCEVQQVALLRLKHLRSVTQALTLRKDEMASSAYLNPMDLQTVLGLTSAGYT